MIRKLKSGDYRLYSRKIRRQENAAISEPSKAALRQKSTNAMSNISSVEVEVDYPASKARQGKVISFSGDLGSARCSLRAWSRRSR